MCNIHAVCSARAAEDYHGLSAVGPDGLASAVPGPLPGGSDAFRGLAQGVFLQSIVGAGVLSGCVCMCVYIV